MRGMGLLSTRINNENKKAPVKNQGAFLHQMFLSV
jgi:hypothetical protein